MTTTTKVAKGRTTKDTKNYAFMVSFVAFVCSFVTFVIVGHRLADSVASNAFAAGAAIRSNSG